MRIDFIDLRFRGSDGGIAPHAMRGEHGLRRSTFFLYTRNRREPVE